MLPLSETDLWFNTGTIGRQIYEARHLGLETWLDPWGVCGLFGGESLTHFVARYPETAQRTREGAPVPAACPNHPATGEFLHEWLKRAVSLSPGGIFWDEPHFFMKTWHPENIRLPACFCAQCDARARSLMDRSVHNLPPDSLATFQAQCLLSLLIPLLKGTRDLGAQCALCLLPEELGGSSVLSGNPDLFATSVDFLCTDPYYHLLGLDESQKYEFVEKHVDRLALARKRWGVKTWIWLPGFLVPDGAERLFSRIATRAREAQTDYLSLWSYRGTEMMSARACEKPDKVWRAFLRLVSCQDAGA